MMKAINCPSRPITLIASLLAVVTLAICSLWLTPPTPALAAAGTPQPEATANIAPLQEAYARAQKALTAQNENITKAGEAAAKTQTLIDTQKAKGTNTAALEAALTTFKTELARAQSEHTAAATLLNAHAGFDANGKVTDVALARQTLRSAQQALADARASLLQARQTLLAGNQAFKLQLAPNRLAREQELLAKQQIRLDSTDQYVEKAQTLIATLKAQGKDTDSLETALATFQQQVATAQASHNTAAAILNTHAGFDSAGQVSDPEQARQTLTSAQQALRDAHKTLQQAGQDAREADRKSVV